MQVIAHNRVLATPDRASSLYTIVSNQFDDLSDSPSHVIFPGHEWHEFNKCLRYDVSKCGRL